MPKSADGTKSLASNNKTKSSISSNQKKGGDSGTKTASKTPAGGGKMGNSTQSNGVKAPSSTPSKMGGESSQKATTNVAAKVKESLAAVKQNTVTKLATYSGPKGVKTLNNAAWAAGGGIVQNQAAVDKITKKLGYTPIGLKTNNPGNLLDSKWQKTMPGYVGPVKSPNGLTYSSYSHPDYGIMAQEKLLGKYYDKGLNTIGKVIDKYAPTDENNSAAANAGYKTALANDFGFSINQPLTKEQVQGLGPKMAKFENAGNAFVGGVFGGKPSVTQVASLSPKMGGMDTGQYPSSQPAINASVAKDVSQVEPSALFSPPSTPSFNVHDGQQASPQVGGVPAPAAPGTGGWDLGGLIKGATKVAENVKTAVTDGYETYTDANKKINAVPGGAKMVTTLAKIFGGMGSLGKHPSTFTGKMDGFGGPTPNPQPTELAAATPSVTPQVPVWLAQMLQMEAA